MVIDDYLKEHPDGGSDTEYYLLQLKVYKMIGLLPPAEVEDLESNLEKAVDMLNTIKERMGWK